MTVDVEAVNKAVTMLSDKSDPAERLAKIEREFAGCVANGTMVVDVRTDRIHAIVVLAVLGLASHQLLTAAPTITGVDRASEGGDRSVPQAPPRERTTFDQLLDAVNQLTEYAEDLKRRNMELVGAVPVNSNEPSKPVAAARKAFANWHDQLSALICLANYARGLMHFEALLSDNPFDKNTVTDLRELRDRVKQIPLPEGFR